MRTTVAGLIGADSDAVRFLPDDTPLLHGGLNLDCLAGARLLAAVNERFGVDVPADDLALDSLESIRLSGATSRPMATDAETSDRHAAVAARGLPRLVGDTHRDWPEGLIAPEEQRATMS